MTVLLTIVSATVGIIEFVVMLMKKMDAIALS